MAVAVVSHAFRAFHTSDTSFDVTDYSHTGGTNHALVVLISGRSSTIGASYVYSVTWNNVTLDVIDAPSGATTDSNQVVQWLGILRGAATGSQTLAIDVSGANLLGCAVKLYSTTGVKQTGNPWGAHDRIVDAISSSSIQKAITTIGADSLVVAISGTGTTADHSSWNAGWTHAGEIDFGNFTALSSPSVAAASAYQVVAGLGTTVTAIHTWNGNEVRKGLALAEILAEPIGGPAPPPPAPPDTPDIIRYRIETSTGTQDVGVWHQLAFARTAGLKPRMYFDGEPAPVGFETGGAVTFNAKFGPPLRLGAGTFDSETGGWDGAIAFARFGKVDRTNEWIETQYNNETSPTSFYSVSPIRSIAGNRAPSATPKSGRIQAPNPITFDCLVGATDPDGNTVTLVSAQALTPANAGTLNVDTGAGQVTFTPAQSTTGTVTFTFTVSDGSLTATATVTVTVDPADIGGTWNRDPNNLPAAGQSFTQLPDFRSTGSQTIWVSPSGGGNGQSQSSPTSFATANTNATAGTIVIFLPGNYSGKTWTKSGSASNPITLKAQTRAYDGSFERSGIISDGQRSKFSELNILANNLLIDGLFFGAMCRIGKWNGAPYDRLKFQYCHASNGTNANFLLEGISGTGKRHGIIEFHRCYTEGPDPDPEGNAHPGSTNRTDYGFRIHSGGFTLIENCLFWGYFHHGISLKSDDHTSVITYNRFMFTDRWSIEHGQENDYANAYESTCVLAITARNIFDRPSPDPPGAQNSTGWFNIMNVKDCYIVENTFLRNWGNNAIPITPRIEDDPGGMRPPHHPRAVYFRRNKFNQPNAVTIKCNGRGATGESVTFEANTGRASVVPNGFPLTSTWTNIQTRAAPQIIRINNPAF